MNLFESAPLLKRLVALVIDLTLLYLIGKLISIFLGNYVMYLGHYKVVIGIVLSTIYFTIAHSNICKGKSIGKKLLELQVVGLNGKYLSVFKSFLRSIIFTIPYCFSDLLNINFGCSMNVYQFVGYTIIPTSLFINHFFIFANPSRQCLHDYLTKSVVAHKSHSNEFKIESISKWVKFLPLIIFCLSIGAFILFLNPYSSQNQADIKELNSIESAIAKNHSLYFSKFYYEFSENEETNKTLIIECFIPTKDADMSSEVYLLTEELAPFKEKYKISKISLHVVKDFNIGIYSHWESIGANNKKMKFDL